MPEFSKKIKALAIEDDYDFFKALSRGAKEFIDFEYAPDGFTAFQMLRRDKFDLILSDVNMPMLDGITLLAELKKKNITTPVLLMSGNIDDTKISSAIQLGAYNVLQKPFEMQELITKANLAIELFNKEEVTGISDQDKAFIYNTLKYHYYNVDRIIAIIHQNNMPASTVKKELEKKEISGKCIFDDIHNLRHYRQSS